MLPRKMSTFQKKEMMIHQGLVAANVWYVSAQKTTATWQQHRVWIKAGGSEGWIQLVWNWAFTIGYPIGIGETIKRYVYIYIYILYTGWWFGT